MLRTCLGRDRSRRSEFEHLLLSLGHHCEVVLDFLAMGCISLISIGRENSPDDGLGQITLDLQKIMNLAYACLAQPSCSGKKSKE